MGHKELLNETFSLCVMTSPGLRWHPRWRSQDVCILLKYFHSLKYFSGVENISPWQSWYKWLCYLYPTVRDIGCWYICCFLFKALIDLSASSVLLKRNICGKQWRRNYLTWQQMRLIWRKRVNDVSWVWLSVTHYLLRVNHRDFPNFSLFLISSFTTIQIQEIFKKTNNVFVKLFFWISHYHFGEPWYNQVWQY